MRLLVLFALFLLSMMNMLGKLGLFFSANPLPYLPGRHRWRVSVFLRGSGAERGRHVVLVPNAVSCFGVTG